MKHRLMLFLVLALVTITFVNALPTGPEQDIVPIKSERYDTWGPKTILATAGNVTEFNTNGSSITQTWQGYFGNITGMIVLGDANNNTLYDWYMASPQGEIYAVRSANIPAWYNVRCSNDAEIIAEDVALQNNESVAEDSVNNTFVVGGAPDQLARFPTADFTYPTFYVANVTIPLNTCPVATMYNNLREPSPYFKEVLLSDQALAPIIYTGIIAHTINPYAESMGFDKRTHDFEMIVGEDGHYNDLVTSTYWFYLELE